MTEAVKKYTRKDFQSDTEIRWCPGCGDYSIFNALTSAFPEMGIKKENFVIVSGIGCSSRFPYYADTYGFHSLHGRAPTVALGAKIANPDLSVWVVTGDGDAMSIGGNHYIHAIRRNIDINILLFNNEIYGLTKGQLSPTSELGKKTKTSPLGSIERPVEPLPLALASGATFAARLIDTNVKMMKEVFIEAQKHKGTSVVEIYTNCLIFNDAVFQNYENKDLRKEHTVNLVHGEPVKFGTNGDKGIVLDGFKPKVVEIGKDAKESDLLIYDAKCDDPTLASIFARLKWEEKMPLPVGIFRNIELGDESYDKAAEKQISEYVEKVGSYDLEKLLKGDDFWKV